MYTKDEYIRLALHRCSGENLCTLSLHLLSLVIHTVQYKTRLFLNMSEGDTETTTTARSTPNEVEEKTAGEDEAPKEEESTATFEPVVRV